MTWSEMLIYGRRHMAWAAGQGLKHYYLMINSYPAIGSICQLPYADSVAPDQPLNWRSLMWEQYCPLNCRKKSYWLIIEQCSSQIRLCRCAGWSGATLSVYGILSGRIRVQKRKLLWQDCCELRTAQSSCSKISYYVINWHLISFHLR